MTDRSDQPRLNSARRAVASAVGAVVVLAMVLQVAAGVVDAALFPRANGLAGERSDLGLWSQSVRRVVRAAVRRQTDKPQAPVTAQPAPRVVHGVQLARILPSTGDARGFAINRSPLETNLPPPAAA